MGRRIPSVARPAAAMLLAMGLLVLPGHVGTSAVARAADCPSAPVTIAKLVHLDTTPGNACYGGRLLTFRAYVSPPCDECGGVEAAVISPRWLDGLLGSSVSLSAGPNRGQISAYVPPALGRCTLGHTATCPFRPFFGGWATVSAHYDGPVAQTCRYGPHPAGKGFSKQDAIAACQQKLIVLSVSSGALPATDAVAASTELAPVGADSPGPWIVGVALGALVLASRWPVTRRRAEPSTRR